MVENPYIDLWADLLDVEPSECQRRGFAWLADELRIRRVDATAIFVLEALTGMDDSDMKVVAFIVRGELASKIEALLKDGKREQAGSLIPRISEDGARRFIAMVERAFWPDREHVAEPLSPPAMEWYLESRRRTRT